MITDENAMFDVLGEFFYHIKREVRVAALEVYERRALISYDIESLLHEQIHDIAAVMFKFRLPEAHPNSSFAQGTGKFFYISMNKALTCYSIKRFQRHLFMRVL